MYYSTGHSISYRHENAMTWTVSIHFPSNYVVLLTRKYSNKLQPIYNNSLTLKFICTKEQEKKVYCKYCRNPLWYLHSFRSHFSTRVWNIQVCFFSSRTYCWVSPWSCTWRMNRWKLFFSGGLCVLMTLRVHERRSDPRVAVCLEDSFFLQLEPKKRSVYVANKMEMSHSAVCKGYTSFAMSLWPTLYFLGYIVDKNIQLWYNGRPQMS